jgi:hypothetical protein
MAQASSAGASGTPSSAPPPTAAAVSAPKLSEDAQVIVDKLEQSQSVFVADLSDADRAALEAADFKVDADVVRDGFFVSKLSEIQKADQQAAKS